MADDKDISNKGGNMKNTQKKSDIALREEAILAFWNTNNIFKKSEEKDSPKGEYVFYDGPPFATGLPHYGSLLSSIAKDVVPRYKTMCGFHVRRRWGWDCHGLPIENMIEKELGLKSKKDIVKMGIDVFNEACRDSVLRYAHDWKDYVERVGRWVEFENAYKTMDNSYIESIWWFLKNMHKKDLLYEGRKVLLYCPRCETPLAKAEVAMDNSYKDVTEESVYVKFKIKNPEENNLPDKTSILAWTTTPWTLPSNAALAVGEDIDYVLVKTKEHGNVILAKSRIGVLEIDHEEIKNFKGKEIIGISYEPLYEILKVLESNKKDTHTILPADFVTAEDGTGVVHTAVIYGEDDYQLGIEKDLPMVPLLDQSGHFNTDAPAIIAGEYFKKAQKIVVEDLKNRGLLFRAEMHTHSYPHCHRCDTALIYSALTSWFLNIQKIKGRLLKTNEDINWVPDNLKNGRYKHILETAPDWTISRNRFWASPLPIWKHSKTGEVSVFGSIEELKAHTKKSGNTYLIMRHGEALFNTKNILNADPSVENPLTEKGIEKVHSAVKSLKGKKIDLIVYSPLQRTKETAELLAKVLGLSKDILKEDSRLKEVVFGEFEGKTVDAYHSFFKFTKEKMIVKPEGGETWMEVKNRIMSTLSELEKEHTNKTILIVSHNGPLQMIQAGVNGQNIDECSGCIKDNKFDLETGEVRELLFVPLPYNKNYELDLHRPYIDNIEVVGDDGEKLERIPEVIDGWVESGSMPFAEYHYPFENTDKFNPEKGLFKKLKRYPADFVSEYIAQTRTWFYYMHAVSVLQFNSASFKSVVTTGNILAEDGTKMSKSKGNYTDPFLNLNKFGADALRYYLMSSVVMQAEDTRFMDDELKESHNRIVNILWNTFKFYDLYKDDYDNTVSSKESPNILDIWIFSRLSQANNEITENLDAYNTVRATRAMRSFIDDFSTWYVRRSRDRFKSKDIEDRKYALSVTRDVLVEFSKLIAPIMPFISESIYKGVQETKVESIESVHLCDWPKAGVVNEERLKEMEQVRSIVSLALEARAAAGIKVRQPLQSLVVEKSELENEPQYAELIRGEVNVKEVKFSGDSGVVELDTTLTEDLKREGLVRDIIRQIQQFRKNSNLSPQESITLAIDTEDEFKKIIEGSCEEIKQAALIKEIIFEPVSGEESSIEGKRIVFALRSSTT